MPPRPEPGRGLRILEVAGSGNIGCGDAMGPVTRGIEQLSAALAGAGHAITIIDAPSSSPRSIPTGVRLLELPRSLPPEPAGEFLAYGRLWRRSYALLKGVMAELRAARYDVVHLYDWPSAWLLSKLGTIPVVYTAHTAEWAAYYRATSSSVPLWRGAARKLLVREIDAMRAVAATVALGSYLSEFAPGANVRVIPYGPSGCWESLPSRAEARNLLQVPSDTFVALTVTRITPIKGLDVLVDALASRPGVVDHLWIVGGAADRDQSYAAALKEKAAGLPVTFCGYLPISSEEMRRRVAAADVFVMPTLGGSQGIAALDAMAAGLPIVASQMGGLGEMVGNAGMLVKPGNAVALSEALEGLSRNPAERLRLSRASRERASRYSWEAAAAEHVSLFRAVSLARIQGKLHRPTSRSERTSGRADR